MANLKDNAVTGIFIGIGAALLAPVVLPILAAVAKPLTKSAMKGGILLYQKGKEACAEAGELFEDLTAEVKAELAEEQAMAAGAEAVAGQAAGGEGKTEG